MKNKILKTIIWKENKVFFKSCFPLCLLYFGLELYFFISNINNAVIFNEKILRGQLFIFTALNMAVMGSLISNINMGVDMKAKVMPILLGMTKRKELIWLAKVVYSFIVGFILSIVGCVAMMYMYFQKGYIAVNFVTDIEFIITGILIGLSFIAINMLIIWIIKREIIVMMISLILPVLLIISIMMLMDTFQKISVGVIGIVAIVGFILIISSYFFIKKIPNALLLDKV